jgi:LysR family transcriptional activator of nhaA
VRHLNYNHLFYFWSVANEGSIAGASAALHLTPQTISGQLKLLEQAVGQPLFQRAGRGLVLSDTGRLVKRYADDIFNVGAELARVVKGEQLNVAPVLHVGIVSSIAKLIAYRVLEPALATQESVRLVCEESGLEELLGELALHRLDLVISDRPVPVGLKVKAFNHALGDSPIAFFASTRQASRYRRGFPRSLDGAPMLLPAQDTMLRRDLEVWFDDLGVQPQIVAEVSDSALLKAFGQAGMGIFPAPVAIAREVERMYRARSIGVVNEVQENYVVISPERRLKHPAVMRITERARNELFAA